MGMGRNKKLHIFPFPGWGREAAVSGATSASPGTSTDSDTLDCHSLPAKKHHVDFNDLCESEDDHQQGRNELAE